MNDCAGHGGSITVDSGRASCCIHYGSTVKQAGGSIMTHVRVAQLRFARSEFKRALEGLTDEDARKRLMPMNCISWIIGHLAWQEQRYWLSFGQDKLPLQHIQDQFRYGAPASTPPLDEMWEAWRTITEAADPWLDTVTTEKLQEQVVIDGKPRPFIFWR